jgi:hypothetical protein
MHKILVRKSEGKRPFGRIRCSERIILGWILRKWSVRMRECGDKASCIIGLKPVNMNN